MSTSVALQTALYARLLADAGVAALVGDRVYDNVPARPEFPYLSFGPSDFVPLEDDCVDARIETFQIDGWTREAGKKRGARILADAVKAALHEFDADLGVEAALVSLRVSRVQVMGDPDGLTAHAVITLSAIIEDT